MAASIAAPNLSGEGHLGFLNFGIQNLTPGPLLSGTFTADANGTMHVAGSAAADLKLSSDMGSAEFPSISADLDASWTLGDSGITGGSVAFNNVAYDFGQFVTDFITPVLQKIEPVLEPLHDALAVVNTDLTFLDAVPGALTAFDVTGNFDQSGNDLGGDGRITVLDFLKLAGYQNVAGLQGFINIVENLIDWAAFLDGKSFGPDKYDLGSFTLPVSINGLVGALSRASITAGATDLNSFLDALAANQPNFGASHGGKTGAGVVTSIFGSPDISFPVIEQPLQLFKLLLGQDVDLVDVTLPPIEFNFGQINTHTGIPTQTVPIQDFVPFPGITVELSGALEAVLQLAFGYDTAACANLSPTDSRTRRPSLPRFWTDFLSAMALSTASIIRR